MRNPLQIVILAGLLAVVSLAGWFLHGLYSKTERLLIPLADGGSTPPYDLTGAFGEVPLSEMRYPVRLVITARKAQAVRQMALAQTHQTPAMRIAAARTASGSRPTARAMARTARSALPPGTGPAGGNSMRGAGSPRQGANAAQGGQIALDATGNALQEDDVMAQFRRNWESQPVRELANLVANCGAASNVEFSSADVDSLTNILYNHKVQYMPPDAFDALQDENKKSEIVNSVKNNTEKVMNDVRQQFNSELLR